MKNALYTFIIILSFLTVASCSTGGQETSPATTAQEPVKGTLSHENVTTCKQLIDSTDALVLDVRTPGEWENGHLANATFIDFYQGDFADKVAQLDKEKTYIVYCAVGGRSAQAANQMRDMGFTHIINMKGGIKDWQREGLPVTK